MVDPKVDAYIARSTKWPEEMAELRTILLDGGLDEAIKWGKPCFSHGDKNIAIMQEMNDFLSLMFFKGALLEDPAGLLRSQGANTRSALRLELTSVDQVREQADTIRDFVADAVRVEEAGLSVGPAPELELCEELIERLASDPDLAAAFEALTPGRQREYNLHFSDAKQAKTREARIDKYVPQILAGKGMRDR
ncbi:YdeI family protein [Aquihabitans daechungensis]|uniref:YdeI/OmpD-associated family protein n=1 Tax=Aquihabitans daechungensis TaxID=1052257 RepID=UPI003B9EEA33